MQWKRIILFSFFSVILVGSVVYYAMPRLAPQSRLDSIPDNAYIVPWMRPNPPIERLKPQIPGNPPTFDVESVMKNALRLSVTFTINIPGGVRVIPSVVYLGHDSDYLYVGCKLTGMYTNPVSTSNSTRPNFLSIFLDTSNDGVLNFPESGSRLSSYVNPNGAELWIYHDMVWAYTSQYKRMVWYMADNYFSTELNKAQPAFARGDMIIEYDNSTGTVTMLFSRALQKPSTDEFNTLQMRPGERWVMGFLLELGYATNGVYPYDFVDGWPRNIYPYLSNDASWWPKLVIDLSNPPTNM